MLNCRKSRLEEFYLPFDERSALINEKGVSQ